MESSRKSYFLLLFCCWTLPSSLHIQMQLLQSHINGFNGSCEEEVASFFFELQKSLLSFCMFCHILKPGFHSRQEFVYIRPISALANLTQPSQYVPVLTNTSWELTSPCCFSQYPDYFINIETSESHFVQLSFSSGEKAAWSSGDVASFQGRGGHLTVGRGSRMHGHYPSIWRTCVQCRCHHGFPPDGGKLLSASLMNNSSKRNAAKIPSTV